MWLHYSTSRWQTSASTEMRMTTFDSFCLLFFFPAPFGKSKHFGFDFIVVTSSVKWSRKILVRLLTRTSSWPRAGKEAVEKSKQALAVKIKIHTRKSGSISCGLDGSAMSGLMVFFLRVTSGGGWRAQACQHLLSPLQLLWVWFNVHLDGFQ